MELNFKTPELDDAAAVHELLLHSDSMFCENTFGNIFCWSKTYGMQLCITDGLMLTGRPDNGHYNFPVGGGDKNALIQNLIAAHPDNLSISCVSENDKLFLEQNFFDVFEITEAPERFDYIYDSEKLRTLSGKKLASKRNHINAFLSDGEWHTERVTGENKHLLFEFNKKWCKSYLCNMDKSLKAEMCAADCGIKNFESLNYDGLILYKNGAIVGYSFGEQVTENMYCVHVEKADAEVRGAYQMVNREFCREFCTDVKYINREDDAGDEGLRKAKKSYYPTELGRKYRAKIR